MFLRIRGSTPSCLLCYQRCLEVKKKKCQGISPKVFAFRTFSLKQEPWEKQVYSSSFQRQICQLSWNREEYTSARHLLLHSAKISHFGRADELAKLFITNSPKTLKSQEDWGLNGCHNFLLRGIPEINSVLVILVKLPTNLWSWSMLFIFPLRYTAL